jgi:ectoine hydroxylase-related dioxygenase (phytanoyl-CoA dioxygenase family)
MNIMQFTPLTPEQRRQFDDDGYLIVRKALDADTVARLIEAGDRLIDSDETLNRQTNSANYDSFRNCISMDDAFLDLLMQETTVPLIVQLFGPNIHLVTSHLIYKLPNPKDTPRNFRQPGWHRDVADTTHDLGHACTPRMEMKCAYYLTDTSEPCSAVTMFAPGSNHLKEKLPIPEGAKDPEGAVEPSLQPGDAVFFENRTYHAGAANLLGRTTKAVMMGYGFNWMLPMDYRTQSDELLDKVDDIGKQLLGGLKDKDGRFIPGTITKPLKDWCKTNNVVYQPVGF